MRILFPVQFKEIQGIIRRIIHMEWRRGWKLIRRLSFHLEFRKIFIVFTAGDANAPIMLDRPMPKV